MSTDTNMNTHNRINGNNELYHRLSSWMADIEDPSLLQESFEDGPLTVEAFRNYMLDEAMEIMYDIYQTCDQTCEDRASTFGGPHDEDGNYWANQLEEPEKDEEQTEEN